MIPRRGLEALWYNEDMEGIPLKSWGDLSFVQQILSNTILDSCEICKKRSSSSSFKLIFGLRPFEIWKLSTGEAKNKKKIIIFKLSKF